MIVNSLLEMECYLRLQLQSLTKHISLGIKVVLKNLIKIYALIYRVNQEIYI